MLLDKAICTSVANCKAHCKAVWTFPQKCAPSVGKHGPITRSLRKDTKVKVNAQGYSHLPTHLMVSVDRYDNYLSKKVSLGTQIFIFCQIWQFKKQYYEEVNKFWLVSYEIEQAPTYEKSHSESSVFWWIPVLRFPLFWTVSYWISPYCGCGYNPCRARDLIMHLNFALYLWMHHDGSWCALWKWQEMASPVLICSLVVLPVAL